MTNKEVQDKHDELKEMRNYPRELVIEHRTEQGKEEVRLHLDYKVQRQVDDLVAKFNDQMNSNISKSLVAKQRLIHQMIDDGFELIVPPSAKWDPKKRDPDFIQRLNCANYNLLNQSLDKMLKPKASTWKGLTEIIKNTLDDEYKKRQQDA